MTKLSYNQIVNLYPDSYETEQERIARHAEIDLKNAIHKKKMNDMIAREVERKQEIEYWYNKNQRLREKISKFYNKI